MQLSKIKAPQYRLSMNIQWIMELYQADKHTQNKPCCLRPRKESRIQKQYNNNYAWGCVSSPKRDELCAITQHARIGAEVEASRVERRAVTSTMPRISICLLEAVSLYYVVYGQ